MGILLGAPFISLWLVKRRDDDDNGRKEMMKWMDFEWEE